MQTLDELAIAHVTDKSSQYHWYTAIYPHYLERYRHLPIRLLELGVYKGASLRMWADYFTHPNRSIIGIDIDTDYLEGDLPERTWAVKSDQATPLQFVIDYGPFDFIIDDASHVCERTIASFKAWWPHLKPGGLYVVEDIQTSYVPEYGGSTNPNSMHTTMGFLKRLADEVQVVSPWQVGSFDRRQSYNMSGYDIDFVHFYPDLCVIQKRSNPLDRLMLAIPLYRQASAAWWINFLQMDRSRLVGHTLTDGVYVTRAMNILVEGALTQPNWDRLVIFEHDMIPPANAFERVAAAHTPYDIVGSMYFMHERPHHVMAWMSMTEGGLSPLTAEALKLMVDSPGMYAVDAVGFGFTSIARRVLENWDPDIPMFDPVNGPLLGHDLWFCDQARKQGFKVWLDSGLGCGHLTDIQVGYPDSLAALNIRKAELESSCQ